MYPLKEEAKKKFNPYFNTAINGVPVRVSIKDMEKNPAKYANTPLVHMYKDPESIVKRILKSQKSSARKVNMNKVSRGLIFDKSHRTPKQKDIDNFLSLQERKLKRFEAKVKAEEAAAAKAESKTTAKKTTKSKKQTAEEAAIQQALEEQNQ